MAGRSDIEAGKAHVSVYVKNSALVKGLQGVRNELASTGGAIMRMGNLTTAAGSLIIAPIAAAVMTFAAMGAELENNSRRTGIGVEALAEYQHAAKQAGGSLEDVVGASKSITKTIADAALGGAGANIALSRLGLTAAGLKRQLPEDQLQTVMEKLAGVKDGALRATLATQLLGGTNLLPVIDQIGALRQEARDLNLVPTEKAVAEAGKLSRMISRAFSAIKASIFEVGAAVAPVLMPIGDMVINITSRITQWIRENQGLVRVIFQVGAAIVAAGAVLTAIGGAIVAVGALFGSFAAIIAGVVAAFTAIGTAIGAFMTLVGALFTPLGGVVVLIVALGAALVAGIVYWARYTESGKRAIAGLVSVFEPYVSIVMTAVRGVADALMAGDLGLAAQIAMKGVRLAFEMAKLAIVGIWLDVRNRVLAVWDYIVIGATGALAFVSSLWGTFIGLLAVSDLGRFMSGMWIAFREGARIAFEYISDMVKGLIATFNSLRKIIGHTLEDVARVAPIAARAALNQQKNQLESNTPKPFKDGLAKAIAESAEAMGAAAATRGTAREQREGEANLWRDAQREVIEENKRELGELAAQAKTAREQGKSGGVADKPRERAATEDLPSATALRQGFGTFSGAALQLAGSDGGLARRQLKAQEEQRDLQRRQLAEQEAARAAAERLEQALRMA